LLAFFSYIDICFLTIRLSNQIK